MLPAFFAGPDAGPILTFGQDLHLVALSIVLAVIASIMALQVATLARTSVKLAHRLLSVGSGSIALGGGIWAMHFVGMTSLELCFNAEYDPVWTAASALPAMLASGLALTLLSREQVRPSQLLAGGTLVGAGIGLMHYGGMLALRTTPLLRFEPWTFALSIVAAVLLATFSLWIREALLASGRFNTRHTTVIAGTLMGGAIAAMHYIGMASVRFIGEAEFPQADAGDGVHGLAGFVALAAFIMGIVALGGNTIVRYRLLVAQLRSSEARLRAMFDTAVDGIVTIDGRGRIRTINRSALAMLQYQPDQLIGHNVSMLMPEPYRSGHDGYMRRYQGGGEPRVIGLGREVTAQRRDGSVLPVRLAVGRVEDPDAEGTKQLYVGFLTDISALKEAQAEREHEAHHDALTGLPNRRAFFMLLESAMHRVQRHGQSLALLFIDLDGFKAVNDQHGHQAGDQLLLTVAERLRGRLRQTDTCARLGGDEFVVLLEGLKDPPGDACQVAGQLLAAAREPVRIDGLNLQVGASIGLACASPGQAISGDALVQLADDAMYRAKRGGRNRVCVSDGTTPAATI